MNFKEMCVIGTITSTLLASQVFAKEMPFYLLRYMPHNVQKINEDQFGKLNEIKNNLVAVSIDEFCKIIPEPIEKFNTITYNTQEIGLLMWEDFEKERIKSNETNPEKRLIYSIVQTLKNKNLSYDYATAACIIGGEYDINSDGINDDINLDYLNLESDSELIKKIKEEPAKYKYSLSRRKTSFKDAIEKERVICTECVEGFNSMFESFKEDFKLNNIEVIEIKSDSKKHVYSGLIKKNNGKYYFCVLDTTSYMFNKGELDVLTSNASNQTYEIK